MLAEAEVNSGTQRKGVLPRPLLFKVQKLIGWGARASGRLGWGQGVQVAQGSVPHWRGGRLQAVSCRVCAVTCRTGGCAHREDGSASLLQTLCFHVHFEDGPAQRQGD